MVEVDRPQYHYRCLLPSETNFQHLKQIVELCRIWNLDDDERARHHSASLGTASERKHHAPSLQPSDEKKPKLDEHPMSESWSMSSPDRLHARFLQRCNSLDIPIGVVNAIAALPVNVLLPMALCARRLQAWEKIQQVIDMENARRYHLLVLQHNREGLRSWVNGFVSNQ